MNRYLVIDIATGRVVNAVAYNGDGSYAPEGMLLVPVSEATQGAWIGWLWDGHQFNPPPEPELSA